MWQLSFIKCQPRFYQFSSILYSVRNVWTKFCLEYITGFLTALGWTESSRSTSNLIIESAHSRGTQTRIIVLSAAGKHFNLYQSGPIRTKKSVSLPKWIGPVFEWQIGLLILNNKINKRGSTVERRTVGDSWNYTVALLFILSSRLGGETCPVKLTSEGVAPF